MSALVVFEKYIIVNGGMTTDDNCKSYILNTGEEKQEWKPLDILLNTPRYMAMPVACRRPPLKSVRVRQLAINDVFGQ